MKMSDIPKKEFNVASEEGDAAAGFSPPSSSKRVPKSKDTMPGNSHRDQPSNAKTDRSKNKHKRVDSKSGVHHSKSKRNTKTSSKGKRKYQASQEEFPHDDLENHRKTAFDINSWRPSYFDIKSPEDNLPFYYHVPQNPAQVAVLLPGTYLVIPQNTPCQSPLKVCHHPQAYDGNYHTKDNGSGAHDSAAGEANFFQVSDQKRDERGETSSQAVKIEDESNADNFYEAVEFQESEIAEKINNFNPRMVDFISALSLTPGQVYNGSHTNGNDGDGDDDDDDDDDESLDKPLVCDPVYQLKRRLPYCDLEELRTEWANDKHSDWKEFIMRMRERKVFEICTEILEDEPSWDLESLKKEVRALLSNCKTAESIVDIIKDKETIDYKKKRRANRRSVGVEF